MIEGVVISPLKTFSDERGEVKHMVKSIDDDFTSFGEIYFSSVLPGKVKAWSRRKTTTRKYAVVSGNAKLVLTDGENSQEITLGDDNYVLVTIPPMVWCGFTAVGDQKAIIADFTDKPYNEEDVERKDASELLDCW